MRTRITTCTLLFTCLLACGSQSASSQDPGGGTSAGGGPAAGSGGESSGGGGAGGGAGESSGAGAGAPAPVIVFNEVLAVGATEWIEIVNPGQTPIDLSNYLIADSSKTTNEPRLADAMKFPAGTTMDPGARIVILTSKKKDEPVGPHVKEACLPDGPETCFFAAFGVSATSGEALHFLAPDGTVITTTAVPVTLSADAGGSTTESQCRLPDTTGDFTACALTPGQPNRAP
jgi:hypothetical protein